MTPLAALAVAGCLAIGSDTDGVLVRDIAPAFASGAALPLETVVSLAPAPGVVRRFDLPELRRIAARLGLPEPAREVCVERRAAPPDPARILDAMRAALPEARIELIDYGRHPVPDGALEFPRAGLRRAGAAAAWTGFVRYGGRHRFALWARVKVSVAATRVIAISDLRPGRPIDAASVRIETRDEFPSPDPFPAALEEVAGRLPRRAIRAGTAIASSWLAASNAVARGDAVQVEVREGGATLQFTAQAQASGAVGQTIPVLNTMSKKRFQARVDAPGRVSVGGPR
jgi:flagella basal body P-ring formation protein FlgA